MKKFLLSIIILGFIHCGMGQSTQIYSDDFTGEDNKGKIGSTNDVTGVDWTINVSAGDFSDENDLFAVQSGIFEVQDVDGTCSWKSETFSISGYTSLEFSFDALADGDFESSGPADVFDVEIYIDGTSESIYSGSVHEEEEGDPMYFGSTELTSSLNSFTKSISATGDNAYIKITANNNAGSELFGWDNLEITGTSDVNNPTGFTASTVSRSQIDLSFSANNDSEEVIIVHDADGSFDVPSGSPPSVGSSFAGGTVLYKGTGSPVHHTGLSDYQDVHYKAWSYDGSDYSPGVTASATTLPYLVIAEIMPDPDAVIDDNGEWFEIYNAGSSTVDMDGYVVKDNGSDAFTISSLSISDDGFLIFADNSNSNENGGISDVDYTYNSFSLSNSDDQIILTRADDKVIDRVDYGSTGSWSISAGYSLTLNPDELDNNNQGIFWYEATSTYGNGDFGTPGQANDVLTADWDGGGDAAYWNEAGNWSDNTIPGPNTDVTISSTKSAVDVEIATNETADCYDLTVAGDNELRLNSGSVNTASLIIYGSASGDITVERSIPDDNTWHFLSSPVSGQDIQPEFVPSGTSLPGDFDFYYFDEMATDGKPWINIRSSDGDINGDFESQFQVGKGYLVAYQESYNTGKIFKGSPNTGTQDIALSYSSGGGQGWNLAGNPFTASIDWNEIDKSDLADNYFYVYDNTANSGAGDYVYHNGSGGDGTSQYISPGQGFFVNVASGGGTLSISPTALAHSDQGFLKDDRKEADRMKLVVSDDTYSDEVIVGLNPKSSHSKDRYDASKLFSMNTDCPAIYALTKDDKTVALNNIPNASEGKVIQLGLYIPAEKTYNISLKEIVGAFTNADILLEDKSTGEMTEMDASSQYTFYAVPGDENRFAMHFKSAIGIDEKNSLSQVTIYSNSQSIYVNSGKCLNNARINIYNTLGQMVKSVDLKHENKMIQIHSPGAYIVKVQAKQGIKTRKVVIH